MLELLTGFQADFRDAHSIDMTAGSFVPANRNVVYDYNGQMGPVNCLKFPNDVIGDLGDGWYHSFVRRSQTVMPHVVLCKSINGQLANRYLPGLVDVYECLKLPAIFYRHNDGLLPFQNHGHSFRWTAANTTNELYTKRYVSPGMITLPLIPHEYRLALVQVITRYPITLRTPGVSSGLYLDAGNYPELSIITTSQQQIELEVPIGAPVDCRICVRGFFWRAL